MASTTFNQYFNKITCKPYVDNQYSQPSYALESATHFTIQQQQQQQYQLYHQFQQPRSDFGSSMVESRPSSSLPSYPLMPNNDCSVWQNTYPTDYLGLPTFDQHQESSSPAVSTLSSLSPSSTTSSSDNIVYSADDFCVSDLLDSHSHQHYMLSPTCTNTTVTTTNLNDPYYTQPMQQQQQQQQQQQHLSPRSEYWISPATPLMESMDGYIPNTQTSTMIDQAYFFVKQEENDSIYMPTPAFTVTMDAAMTASKNASNKRPAKKIHQCPHCHHTSNRANNMKEHILTHDPYRPKLFACSTCQKCFARKHDMKRHTKSHQRVQRRQSKVVTAASSQRQQRKQRKQQD